MAKFTSSDGLSLHYTDTGQGTPVLCLAGLTRNHRDFGFVAPHLDDCRLIMLDTRGRGESDHDSDFMNYNIMRESQDALDLLDHLGLDKVVILGTSRGGLIAMTLAAGHIGRLAGVILNDIGPVIDPVGLGRIMGYVGLPPAQSDLDSAAAAMQAAMEPQFPGVPLDRWRAQVAMIWAETDTGLALRYDAALRDALLAQIAASADTPAPDLWPVFDLMATLPVAVIRGANSDLLSAETVAQMKARHPALVVAEIPDRGHVPFLDEPAALDAIRQVVDAAA